MAQRLHYRAAFGGVLNLPVPTVAAIAGYALGGGFELALSCDLIVADETAVVGLPEVTVGVIPGGGGTQLVARRIGASRAADLIFTGRRLDIDEAGSTRTDRSPGTRRICPGGGTGAGHADRGQLAVGVRNAKRALRLGLDIDMATGLDVEDSAWRATAFSADGARGWPPSTRSGVPNGLERECLPANRCGGCGGGSPGRLRRRGGEPTTTTAEQATEAAALPSPTPPPEETTPAAPPAAAAGNGHHGC